MVSGDRPYAVPMRIRTWLFFGFVLVPIAEIVLFYYVGTWLGILPTIALVVVTAIVGSWLVSKQGKNTWVQLQTEIVQGGVPDVPIVHGAMILVAGALLLTPGFLTDAVGLALLIPAVREFLRVWGSNRLASRWVVIK
jgi:UPF0716 protein FxsA